MSGGDQIFQRPSSWPWVLLKRSPAAHAVLSLLFCAHRKQTQNCALKPDAVKIFITDCPPPVKRNSFPSGVKAAPVSLILRIPRLRRLNHGQACRVKSFTPIRLIIIFSPDGPHDRFAGLPRRRNESALRPEELLKLPAHSPGKGPKLHSAASRPLRPRRRYRQLSEYWGLPSPVPKIGMIEPARPRYWKMVAPTEAVRRQRRSYLNMMQPRHAPGSYWRGRDIRTGHNGGCLLGHAHLRGRILGIGLLCLFAS